jgi:lipoprotein-anchoring transpeptidase ErfK/SrfK
MYNYMTYGGQLPQKKKGGSVEPNGEMALGQMAAVQDKMSKLLQFIQPDDNLDPWIASKLAVMDHSADAIADYMMYGPEAEEMGEMEEMKSGGGIPERYKNKGFTRVGAKRQSNRPGKKWMVLAKKGDDYKIVHGGYKGMKDYTQHGNAQRRENFWNRMGGKNSAKATDPFSPLYWHKRFGTWQEGGEIEFAKEGKNYSIVDYLQSQGAQSDFATREKLAETIYGIKDYTGSAEQNLQLLKFMSGEALAPGQPVVKDFPSTRAVAAAPVKKAPVDKPLPGKASSQRIMLRQDITKEKLPANLKNERDLQSGFVVDKRSNTGYIIENGQVKRSFPVLTGQNPDGTSNTFTVDQLQKNPAGRATPAGTYMMQPRADIFGAPGFHMNPVAAFGDPAVGSKAVAVHTTYDPAVRSKYYNMDANQRYRSYGCVNCKKPDIMELSRTFPQGDTIMVIDPKTSAKDRRYLESLKRGKQAGGLVEYGEGDFVPSGLPKYDAQKGMLNILNPFAKSIDDPFKSSFYNPFTREYGTPKPAAKPKLTNPYNKDYDYITPALVNMGLSGAAGIAQGISDNRNINYNTSDSLMPVVRNNYNRGRNEINTGRYADDSLVPVQFAGTPVAEYYGAPMYKMAAGGSFDVSSGILGLPKMKEDAGDYREAQLNFDMPMNSAPEMEASRYSSDAMPPGRDMMGYRNYIKMRESRGDYGALSKKSSATGAYQFIWSLHNDWIKSVTGVKSKQEFLKNPEAQEKAFDYWDNNTLTPAAMRIKRQTGTADSLDEIKMKVHFAGPGGAMKYYQTGEETVDAYGTKTSTYAEGGEYDLSDAEIQQILMNGGQVEFL